MEKNSLQEDNQQESSEVIKNLSWLGGIIDGEGTITIRYHARKNQSPLLQPVFTVVNTDDKIINKIIEILQEHNIPFWVSEYKQTKNWKARRLVEISGIKRLLKFLPVIRNYLVGKQEECDIVLDWCKSRLNSYEQYRNHKYYTEDDFKTLIRIKKLHGHQDEIDYKRLEKLLKSSETTR